MIPVPKRFPGETIVCIGSGPSLTDADVAFVQGKARVIVVNDNYRKAPWADALYAADKEWWREYDGVPSFQGMKYSLAEPQNSRHWPTGVALLRNTGVNGLETDPSGLRTGRNSGYQAINLAVHLGAQRILLLGYDMQRGDKGELHWFGKHPNDLHRVPPFVDFLKAFPTMVQPLQAIRVEVINCSRRSALTVFPQMPIDQALKVSVAA